ncbi:MAG: hypothetical protein Kow0019_06850 [Methanobacteriaceae archaeon]
MSKPEPEVWRVLVTVFLGLGWLVFLSIWFFFYITYFSFFQNLAIFILSIVIVGAICVLLWVPYGMKYGK